VDHSFLRNSRATVMSLFFRTPTILCLQHPVKSSKIVDFAADEGRSDAGANRASSKTHGFARVFAHLSKMSWLCGSSDENVGAAGQAISSVTTSNRESLAVPNDVVIATSVASMPVPISTRPMRGILCRASRVHQRSPR
jgi:hypothetical protein